MADLLEVVVRSVADGLYPVDAAGTVKTTNPIAVALLGYDA